MVEDLNEARKLLEACLSEELREQYFASLRQWFLFSGSITKEEFDKSVRKLFVNAEQLACHNDFLVAILSKANTPYRKQPPTRPKSVRTSNEKGVFQCADFSDYVQPSSPNEFESRSAAAELFIPDSGFISSRIAIMAWKNGLKGADDNVTELIVHACQVFVKNIITAMISRKKGYKIRNGNFQYGFNQAVPDPFIRNYNNIIDETQESKVEVLNEDDSFTPKCKVSLENMEQQVAFSYSCAKRRKTDNILSVQLLYDTIRENPKLLALHSIQSVNLLKLGLQLDDDD